MNSKNYSLKFILFLSIGFFYSAQAQLVIQNDSTYNTASQMFLANELFESGEPFAEALGYDLDLLDPVVPNIPDSISYTTGIEGYEYSRYLLNTLNGRSGMGLHMMWSPIITMNAAMQPASFDGMFTGGMVNGYKEDDMLMMMMGNFGMNAHQMPPQNAFPQFADFESGNNNLPQTVAADFQMDYGTTRWDRTKMSKVLNLGSMGQSMWKQYYWAQDMLGSFHDSDDNGVVPTGDNSPDSVGSSNLDPDNNIYYGGNNVDGFIGQVLTAVSINKTNFLISNLAYDGTTLGAVDPATYNPTSGIKYFPTRISVTETAVATGLPPKMSNLTVLDNKSQLFDQLSFLLATSNYVNMMDPSNTSDEAHLAYKEVFDGSPFPADMATTGTPGPFDLMKGTSKVIFLNIMAMHYNSSEGTFVNESSLNGAGIPIMGNEISAENAAYIIISLSKFSTEFAGTPLQTMADNAIETQANYILSNFIDANGGYYNSYTIGTGASTSPKTIAANAAIIRGLYAAYNHTSDINFLNAANTAYNFMINNYYSPTDMAYSTTLGDINAVYTPWNMAFFAGATREASLTGNQNNAALIYTRVSKSIFNKMLLAEAEASGETGSDSDGDGIPYIVGGTKPFIFAEKGEFKLSTITSVNKIENNQLTMNMFPNPTSDILNISYPLDNNSTAQLSVFDITGKRMEVSYSSSSNNGFNTIQLSASNLPTGPYVLRLEVDNELFAIERFIKK